MAAHLRTSRKRGSHPEKTHGSWSPNNPFDSKRARALAGGLAARRRRGGDEAKKRAAARGRKLAGKGGAKPKKPGPDTPAVAALKKLAAERAKKKAPEPAYVVDGRDPVFKGDPGALNGKPHAALFATKDGKLTGYFAPNPVALRKMGREEFEGAPPAVRVYGEYDPVKGLDLFSLASTPDPDELRAAVKRAYPDLDRFTIDGERRRVDGGEGENAPVSAALKVPNTAALRPAKDAIAAIDRVHDDGDMADVEVKAGIRSPRTMGEFRAGLVGRPQIRLKGKGSIHPRMTAAHEIGHALDHGALGEPKRFASRARAPEVAPVLKAAENTAAVQKLLDMRNNPSDYATSYRSPISGRESSYPPDARFLKYLVSPEEVFARGYAQYIAEKGGDPAMKRELDKMVADGRGKPKYPIQWEDGDFAPMRKAFDEMFEARGWLKR